MNFNLMVAIVCGVLAAIPVQVVTPAVNIADAALITSAIWNAWIAGCG